MHSSILQLVKLPEAATVTTLICETGSSTNCITQAQADGHKQISASAHVRVGHHAYDRSYVQYYLGPNVSPVVAVNVSVEYSVTNGGASIDFLVTPVPSIRSAGGRSDGSTVAGGGYELVIDLRYAWYQAGKLSTAESQLSFAPAGFPNITLFTTKAGTVSSSSELRISLNNGAVGFSTDKTATASMIAAKLAAARATEEGALIAAFGDRFAGRGMAVKASVMWNFIYNNFENGQLSLYLECD